jgi:Ca-activated chloride channel family protein
MTSFFRFESPFALLFLIIPLAMIVAQYRRRNTQAAGLRYADTALALAPARSWKLAARPYLTVFRYLVMVIAIVALARPQAGTTQEIILGEGVDIALALDISGSMAALDFQPSNRLEAAKEVISEFIDERDFDRVGLVVFASNAYNQSPPTIDHDVLHRLLDDVQLATALRIPDGTAIGLGLANAANMLKDSKAESRVIILLTDGVNNAGEIDPLTAAQAAEALGVKIYTIGAGKPGQTSVVQFDPIQGQRTVQRTNSLDEEILQQIADTTGGRYYAVSDTEGLRAVYDEINQLEKSEIEVRTFSRFTELAPRLLLPAALILLAEMSLKQTMLRKIP